MFSQAFFRENGEEPSPLWIQAVNRLSDQQIISGLVNLGNDDLKFPPNLSMFLSACKRSRPVRQLGVRLLPLSDAERQANADKAWANMEKLAGRPLPRDA